MKKEKKYKRIGKFETLLYTFTFIIVLAFPFGIVFSQATLSKINFEVEKAKEKIEEQEKKNESLSMKISELASMEKMIDVAKKEGLSYNNNNIKSIEK